MSMPWCSAPAWYLEAQKESSKWWQKESCKWWLRVPLLLVGRHHLERQLRQNPDKIMTSMFCTSVRMRRCSASFEKA